MFQQHLGQNDLKTVWLSPFVMGKPRRTFSAWELWCPPGWKPNFTQDAAAKLTWVSFRNDFQPFKIQTYIWVLNRWLLGSGGGGLFRAEVVTELLFKSDFVKSLIPFIFAKINQSTSPHLLGGPEAEGNYFRLKHLFNTVYMKQITHLLGDRVASISSPEYSLCQDSGGHGFKSGGARVF